MSFGRGLNSKICAMVRLDREIGREVVWKYDNVLGKFLGNLNTEFTETQSLGTNYSSTKMHFLLGVSTEIKG